MARVYAAVANGGTLVTPHIGKAIITPDGKVVRTHQAEAGRPRPGLARRRCAGCGPPARGHRGAAPATGRSSGPASRWRKMPVASKTGTAEVYGKQTTSWFATFAPAEQAAVRRRDDGQPGRHRVRHLRAVGRRDLQDAVRRQGPAGRPGQGASPPGRAPDRRRCRTVRAGRHRSCTPGVRPAGSRPGARRRRSRPCAAPDAAGLPARRGGPADERRLPPRAVHRAAAPGAAPELLRPRRRRCAGIDWMLLLAVARRCARIGGAAGLVGDPAGRSRAGGDPTAFLKKHCLNIAHRARRSAWSPSVFDYRMLRAYAPVLYLLSVARAGRGAVAARHHDQRRALLDRAAGRLLDPALGVREGRARRRHGDAAVREARRRGRPRATSTWCWRSAFAAVPLALVMLQPDLGTALVIVARSCSAWSRSPAPRCAGSSGWSRAPCCSRVVADPGRRAQGLPARPVPAFTDPTADPKGVGYNVRQAASRSAPAGCTARGCSTAPRPRASSCPSSRPTSSSPWRGRSSASSAPARIIAAARLVLWRAGRIAMRAEDLFGRLLATGVALLVRLPGLREHRHDARDHAGDRRAAAVRVLRRVLDVRQHAGRRACCRTSTCAATPDHRRAIVARRGAGSPWMVPSYHRKQVCRHASRVACSRAWSRCCRRSEADPVRRRRAQLHGQGLGRRATSAGR